MGTISFFSWDSAQYLKVKSNPVSPRISPGSDVVLKGWTICTRVIEDKMTLNQARLFGEKKDNVSHDLTDRCAGLWDLEVLREAQAIMKKIQLAVVW